MQPDPEEAGYEDVEYVEEVVYEEVSDEEGLEEVVESAAAAQPAAVPATSTSHAASQHVTAAQGSAAPATTTATPAPAAAPAARAAAVEASSDAPTAAHQPTDPAPPAAAAAPGDFQVVEQSAAKVAAEVQAVAAKLQHSLLTAWHGPSTSSSGSPTSAVQPQSHHTAASAGGAAPSPSAGLSALTGSISSWWSNLDASLAAAGAAQPNAPKQQQQRGHTSPEPATTTKGVGGEGLALEAGEHLLESYPCALAQLYAATGNTLTPPVEVLFPGTLHITGRRSLFEAGSHPPRASGPAAAPAAGADSSSSISSSSGGPPAPTAVVMGAVPGPPWWCSIPHAAVAGASHGRGSRRHHRADQLQLAVSGRVGVGSSSAEAAAVAAGGGSSPLKGASPRAREQQAVVVFTEFEAASGLDDALSLIEHCREEGAAAAAMPV